MANGTYLFSSESVTEGHPDKVADLISDTILDAYLTHDPESLVACETLVTTGLVVLAGEIKTRSDSALNYQDLVRGAIRSIGYVDGSQGFAADSCAVMTTLHEQSKDIRQGVEKANQDMGAGDQGMMFGYACDDTAEKMPITISLAHKVTHKLAELRKSGAVKWLGPDGKSQVTVEFKDHKPHRIHTVVVSTQHAESVSHKEITDTIKSQVLKSVLPDSLIKGDPILHINPTGRFVIGGPHGDSGLTGRKIIVDTYGGNAPHGGGAFSGKDPTKVDRSAAYMARYIAKNVVAAGLASRFQVQLAYAIGVAQPVSVFVDAFGTEKVDLEKIQKAVVELFPLKPADIIAHLKLRRPIYKSSTNYGHFGREHPDLNWERNDKVADLKSFFKI
jgi:S-adenosylmethionine synthetase